MSKVIETTDEIWLRKKKKVWEVLGGEAVSRIPVPLWEPDMMIMGVSNGWWREETGQFPAKLKPNGTHPLFVLRRSSIGFMVCPCTSKGSQGKYVRQGCVLKLTGRTMDRNSYILERYAFGISKTMRVGRKSRLLGIVPETCLAGGEK